RTCSWYSSATRVHTRSIRSSRTPTRTRTWTPRASYCGRASRSCRSRPCASSTTWRTPSLTHGLGRREREHFAATFANGCGDRRLALGVAPLATRVEGIDPDPEAIAAAKRNARKAGVRNVRFAAGAAQHLPYPDAAFDLVILSWTL